MPKSNPVIIVKCWQTGGTATITRRSRDDHATITRRSRDDNATTWGVGIDETLGLCGSGVRAVRRRGSLYASGFGSY
jgi:hypothetical protein